MYSLLIICANGMYSAKKYTRLEVAANPFIVLCGPQKYCEFRLSISQGFQGIGAIIGPVVAGKVLPEFVESETSLGNVQWVYLGIAFFVFVLAIAIYYSVIPEVKYVSQLVMVILNFDFFKKNTNCVLFRDSDFPTHPERNGPTSLWKSEYVTGFAWSIMAQFLYCGVQEIMSRFSGTYLEEGAPTTYNYSSTSSHGLFIAGRFVAGFVALVLRPRYILLASMACCTISTIFSLVNTGMSTGIAVIQIIWFFEVNTSYYSSNFLPLLMLA